MKPVKSTVSRRKARTGCLTCKSRHVKCDERKPACLRCIATQQICEGYRVVPPSVSSQNALSDEERRAFAFFRSRTVPRILGQQDADDWVPVFFQLGQNEDSVKHAITALASLHESLEPSMACPMVRSSPRAARASAQVLALKYYTRAIKLLRVEAPNMVSNPDLMMILCILFICFEQLRSGDAACVLHLTAGLKLIHWWRSNTNSYTQLKGYSRLTLELMNERITPILQRLRVQFALCMDSRHTLNSTGVPSSLPPPTILSSYSSLDLARKDFDRAMNYAFSTLENDPITTPQRPCISPILILQQWKNALDASTFATESSALQTCVRKLLELYHHVFLIITTTYGTQRESVFDQYIPQFEAIVDLAEQITEIWANASQQFSLLFSFDLGITPPMFLVASRCRHSRIRRRAVSLMFRSPFYHGIWRDQYSGLCAQRIIDIEEQDLVVEPGEELSVCVPEHRRIRKLSADIQEENRRIIMHFLRRPLDSDTEVLTTYIPLDTEATSGYTII
ncbi:hypothetical protein P170DRAFT_514224 [Aspergillus steynii IBT 23096]|uniref:Zn(2)-C6 fungal-type domain-containing protein n=1 Tax=Aspergillus steynii IBT 23096 TaxID=1392250 RepID=A0A2I2FTF7_9EURO|nr:uncharacterized protein P170DRAFT_514224 [Aspergillus steynii IBT 23096]PLB43925.1 hypothetical protein P170DRAFT_514224 [Aspergillus steynii IBT 23096]